jgi:Flp pilus assembly protein TadG
VEAVFFILFFALLFFGSVELGRGVALKHSLDVGVYRAARYLSYTPSDMVTATAMVRSEVQNNVLGGAYAPGVRVAVAMPSQSFQSAFTVRAEVDYTPVIPMLITSRRTIYAEHSQLIEKYP